MNGLGILPGDCRLQLWTPEPNSVWLIDGKLRDLADLVFFAGMQELARFEVETKPDQWLRGEPLAELVTTRVCRLLIDDPLLGLVSTAR